MLALGRIYEQGIGTIRQDVAKALAYYDHAMQFMEPYAFYKVGQFLELGAHPECSSDRKPNY